MEITQAKFNIGQKVRHNLFGYRGVVLDVDAVFGLSEEWYARNGKSKPAKDAPWYHVLVHDTSQMAYVAQMNLQSDMTEEEIEHPVVDLCFDIDAQGHYQRRLRMQ